MKARPILFSGDMIRALIAGRKTQTRRVLSLPTGWGLESPDGQSRVLGMITSHHPKKGRFGAFISREDAPGFTVRDIVPCPYGQPGDLLWVQEEFGYGVRSVGGTPHEQIVYRASNPDAAHCYDCNGVAQPMKWKDSSDMPRSASRLTLEITGVRVERLQDISDADAVSEGCNLDWYRDHAGTENLWPCPTCSGWQVHSAIGSSMGATEVDCTDCDTPKTMFSALWKSLYGPGSWDENPWVWAIEFDVHQCNVDELIRQREGQPS